MSIDKLPEHFILEVFKKLCAKDLLRVRLVCRNWATIVSDSIALRRKYSLYVSSSSYKNIDLETQRLHSFVATFTKSAYNICTNISFRDLLFDGEYGKHNECFEILDRLWSKIGENIESLRIYLPDNFYKESTQNNWLALLENTPNLINLEISSCDIYFPESTDITSKFNLAKLKTVAVTCWDNRLYRHLMKIFTKSAIGLTSIQFHGGTELKDDSLYFLIESQRHSLRELKLSGGIGKENLQKCFTIDNLSLEVLYLHFVLDIDLLQLLSKHENLRELIIKYPNSSRNLHQYPTYLPKLEKLGISISCDPLTVNIPFPKDFNNLKSLTITANGNVNNIIQFETPSICRTLEILEINAHKHLNISPISLQSFIDSFPNLRVLKLNKINCEAQSVAAICDVLVHLEELELRIHTTNIAIDRDAFSNISNIRKLNRLSVKDYISFYVDSYIIDLNRLPSPFSSSWSVRHILPPAVNVNKAFPN